MPIDEANILTHELIGLKIRIIGSSSSSQVGLEGVIVDETRNMFVISLGSKEKKIFKAMSIFLFQLPNGKKISVDGALLLGRSEDRLKRKWKKVRW